MKKIGIAILSLVSAIALSSCATKHNGPYLSATPGNPSITAPADGVTYTLTEAQAKDTLFTMKWTKPDYGYPAAVTYTIQIDKPGDNFSNPVKLGTANLPSFSISYGDMNSALLGYGFKPGQSAAINVRVTASVSDSIKAEVSKSISMVLTPYSSYSYIYVPGDYQAASGYGSDWTPADAPSLVMSGNKVYDGYVYMTNPAGTCQFKFTNDKTWTLNWGAGSNAGSLLVNSNNNLVTPDTGYYKIHVDLNALTYTIEKTNWAVIGDATPGGWATGTKMTYNPSTKVWSVIVKLTAGSIKFRANGSWALNYGDGGNGTLVEGGNNNIPVSVAGTYKVVLDLSSPPFYTYSLIKQ